MASPVETPIPESAPAAAEPAPPSFEERIIDALERFSSRLDALESAGPRFVPATVETYGAAQERYETAQRAPADGVPRSQTIPIFSNGEKVPNMVMQSYRPAFGSGSRVRLNPAAVPYGRTDEKTRGELMADQGVPDAVGEVLDRTFLAQNGTWKYRVRFPSRTLPGSNGGITALHEPELIPA